MQKPVRDDFPQLNRPNPTNLPDDTELNEDELDEVTGGTENSSPVQSTTNIIKKQHELATATIKNIKV